MCALYERHVYALKLIVIKTRNPKMSVKGQCSTGLYGTINSVYIFNFFLS